MLVCVFEKHAMCVVMREFLAAMSLVVLMSALQVIYVLCVTTSNFSKILKKNISFKNHNLKVQHLQKEPSLIINIQFITKVCKNEVE